MRASLRLALGAPLLVGGCCCFPGWWVDLVDPIHEDCDRDATEVPADLAELPVPEGAELICAGRIYGRISVALWDVGQLEVGYALDPAEEHLRATGWTVEDRVYATEGYRTKARRGDEKFLLGTAERYAERRVTWLRGPAGDDLWAIFLVAGGVAIIGSLDVDDDDDGSSFDFDDD